MPNSIRYSLGRAEHFPVNHLFDGNLGFSLNEHFHSKYLVSSKNLQFFVGKPIT